MSLFTKCVHDINKEILRIAWRCAEMTRIKIVSGPDAIRPLKVYIDDVERLQIQWSYVNDGVIIAVPVVTVGDVEPEQLESALRDTFARLLEDAPLKQTLAKKIAGIELRHNDALGEAKATRDKARDAVMAEAFPVGWHINIPRNGANDQTASMVCVEVSGRNGTWVEYAGSDGHTVHVEAFKVTHRRPDADSPWESLI